MLFVPAKIYIRTKENIAIDVCSVHWIVVWASEHRTHFNADIKYTLKHKATCRDLKSYGISLKATASVFPYFSPIMQMQQTRAGLAMQTSHLTALRPTLYTRLLCATSSKPHSTQLCVLWRITSCVTVKVRFVRWECNRRIQIIILYYHREIREAILQWYISLRI